MSENEAVARTVVCVVGIVASLLFGAIAVCNLECYLVTKAALENGYSQQTLPGRDGVYWVKNGKEIDK